jgi:predicted N-formylglutamate amidohydrolase
MERRPAFEIVNPRGRSRFVLTCEHASNFIPARYGKLGLSDADLQRHIAWDIGAASVARRMAAVLDAPLILSGYSRLLADCNRPLQSPTLMPVVSETTVIPGNQNLSAEEVAARVAQFHQPFQNAVAGVLDRRKTEALETVLVAMHSFTPVFKGFVRPWHAGILFRRSQALGTALVDALHAPPRIVAANEPYQISDDGDYTLPVHAEARGLEAVLVEIRQDLIADEAGAETWARTMVQALAHV